ncbi:hypothetical protein L3X38_026913 [Prunus dulcis]|uniref:Uncharacterized protein n=1 Tax=Prunus dulcis TaxID=3755 RepID=A0AAD4YYY7_PRUDU|nr:hypothetical protein L3X38_026913 [Prunus dulcis]
MKQASLIDLLIDYWRLISSIVLPEQHIGIASLSFSLPSRACSTCLGPLKPPALSHELSNQVALVVYSLSQLVDSKTMLLDNGAKIGNIAKIALVDASTMCRGGAMVVDFGSGRKAVRLQVYGGHRAVCLNLGLNHGALWWRLAMELHSWPRGLVLELQLGPVQR